MKNIIFMFSLFVYIMSVVTSCNPPLSNYKISLADSKDEAHIKARQWAKAESKIFKKHEIYNTIHKVYSTHFQLHEQVGSQDMVANVIYLDDQLIGLNLIYSKDEIYDIASFENHKKEFADKIRNESGYNFLNVEEYQVFEAPDDDGNYWYHTMTYAVYDLSENIKSDIWFVSVPVSQSMHFEYVINTLNENKYSGLLNVFN